jgi:hypothetical protein
MGCCYFLRGTTDLTVSFPEAVIARELQPERTKTTKAQNGAATATETVALELCS